MDRWQQIEDVYHAALERSPQQRASFLDEACRGDAALRQEIESLLLQEPEAAEFLETPHWQTPIPPIKKRVFDGKGILRVGIEFLTSKLALQLAMVPPIIIIAWEMVENRNRTIADLVGSNTGYIYWIAAAGLLLQFRDKIRNWLDRNM
jgi:hypothetical protein